MAPSLLPQPNVTWVASWSKLLDHSKVPLLRIHPLQARKLNKIGRVRLNERVSVLSSISLCAQYPRFLIQLFAPFIDVDKTRHIHADCSWYCPAKQSYTSTHQPAFVSNVTNENVRILSVLILMNNGKDSYQWQCLRAYWKIATKQYRHLEHSWTKHLRYTSVLRYCYPQNADHAAAEPSFNDLSSNSTGSHSSYQTSWDTSASGRSNIAARIRRIQASVHDGMTIAPLDRVIFRNYRLPIFEHKLRDSQPPKSKRRLYLNLFEASIDDR